ATATVRLQAMFSSIASLSAVTFEYYVEDVNSTSETIVSLTGTAAGNNTYTAVLPGQADRTIVRYRVKANRGSGVEVVSPRSDDPAFMIGPGGTRQAWHAYFVDPV